MITLTEKLLAIQLKATTQQLANDIAILTILGDVAKVLQMPTTLDRIIKELEVNRDFLNQVSGELSAITKKGPQNAN